MATRRRKHLWLLLQSEYSSVNWPLRSSPERSTSLVFSPHYCFFTSFLLGHFLFTFEQSPWLLSNGTSYLSLVSTLDGLFSHMAHLIQILILTNGQVIFSPTNEIFLKGLDWGLLFAFLYYPANNTNCYYLLSAIFLE